jgi:hypothetical protein
MMWSWSNSDSPLGPNDPASLTIMGSSGTLVEYIPSLVANGGVEGMYLSGAPAAGPFCVNGGHPLVDMTDGTSSTILIDELRIGPAPTDIRGTWALGQVGASLTAGQGRDDGAYPNISQSGWDDITYGANDPSIQMGVCNCGNNQVTAKSMHFNGVVTGFCDGHVSFISNSVTQSVWFMLHSRNDGEVVSGFDY